MSVLSASQSACARLVGRRPASIYSSSGQLEVEIADLANEAATDIMKGNDWQRLTVLYTLTGDGVTTAFQQPDDYDRMLLASFLHDPNNYAWGYDHITSVDDWITQNEFGFTLTPGAWIILGGQFQFVPAPGAAESAVFPYISKNYCQPSTGTPTSFFSQDDDTFRLDERLLTLGIIWRWKAMKGQPYAEDLQSYEQALSQEQARDRGASVIRSRGQWGQLYDGPWGRRR